MSYEDYRRTQLADGQLYQDFVVDVAWQAGIAIAQYASKAYQFAVGESRGGYEIKHDKRFVETGNLCIETAEKARPRSGPYAPAGIMRDGHWLYVIGNYDVVYFFANKLLRMLSAAKGAEGRPRYRHYEIATSQGFLLPRADAEKYAALVLRPDASGKVSKLVGDLEELARQFHADIQVGPTQHSLFAEGMAGRVTL